MADYTILSLEEIQTMIGNYDLGELEQAVPLSGSRANSSYRLVTTRGSFTLSVCDEKSPEEIHVLTRVLDHLRANRFPATRLVRASDGRDFIDFDGKPVYIKEFLDGDVVRDLDRPMLEQAGAAMATLHGLPVPEYVPRTFAYGLDDFGKVLTAEPPHPFKAWLVDKRGLLVSFFCPAAVFRRHQIGRRMRRLALPSNILY